MGADKTLGGPKGSFQGRFVDRLSKLIVTHLANLGGDREKTII
jgi:hypothetical protein